MTKKQKSSQYPQQLFAPWKNLGLYDKVLNTTKPKQFKIPFVPKMDCKNAKVGFIIEQQAKTKIILENIEFKEITTAPFIKAQMDINEFIFARPLYKQLSLCPLALKKDILKCYIDLEKDYLNTMYSFLKKDCNVKTPFTGIGGYSQSEDIDAQVNMDFIDTHTYWDHPQFPNKPWDGNDFRIHNKSMLEDKNLGIIGRITKRHTTAKAQFNKPFTITEWNHCFPNQYAYETPPAYGGKSH